MLTKPRYYLYIEPLKGGQKWRITAGVDTTDADADADITGGTEMTKYDVDYYIRKAYERNQELYYDNPEWLDDMAHRVPEPFNFWFKNEFNRKVAEEAKRRDEDMYRNTGQSWKNSPYKFMAYQSSFTGRNNYGFTDSFEATSSVISLYKKWW